MFRALKSGGECSVNFRVYGNSYNDIFYNYYTERKGELFDRNLRIETNEEVKSFDVKVLDYTQCVNDDGTADAQIRQLIQQIYFTSTQDIVALITASGFKIQSQAQFHFSSPVNPDNEIEVFNLVKP